VSLLIYGIFNASLSSEELKSAGFKFSIVRQAWETGQSTLTEGDTLDFSIARFQHANGVLNIDGSII
jgi:hypothetical protein